MTYLKINCYIKQSISYLFLLSFLSFNYANAGSVNNIKTSCKQRLLTIPDNFNDFEKSILGWIQQCVKSKSKKNGKPVRREIKLVKGNSSLVDTWSKVSRMHGNQVGIVANYIGKNRIKRIVFSPRGFDSKPIEFKPDLVKVDSLMKRRWKKKASDIKKGEKAFRKTLKIPMKAVRDIASMPENPVGTPDSSEVLKLLKQGHPKNLIKYTVGGLIDVLTANQSKNVSAQRKKLYESYSEGIAKALDGDYRVNVSEKTEIELAFYKLGKKSTKNLKPLKRHQLRVYLIESYRTFGLSGYNPLEGNLSYFERKSYGSLFQTAMMNVFSSSNYSYR